MMNRGDFLKSLAALTSGIMLPQSGRAKNSGKGAGTHAGRDRWGKLLPQRKLGRTGEAVTMMGIGGWHIGGQMSEKEARRTIEAAMEEGVRFFDTAENYQDGESERRYGKYLTPKYRDEVFLMTKTLARDAEQARRDLEGSLRRLDTGYLDLWQAHSLQSPEDAEGRLASGVAEVMRQAKEEGKVRHIGFTGHRTPYAHQRMLGETDFFETVQMPVNVLDPSFMSFIENVLPIAADRNMGVLAMKTLANGRFFEKKSHGGGAQTAVVPDRISIRQALNFVWSLPVSTIITGPDNAEMLRENVQLARDFTEMGDAERQELVARVADLADGSVQYFKEA